MPWAQPRCCTTPQHMQRHPHTRPLASTHLAVELHELGREQRGRRLHRARQVPVLGRERSFSVLSSGPCLVRTQPRLLRLPQLHSLVRAGALVAHGVPVAVMRLPGDVEHGRLAGALLRVRLVALRAHAAQEHGRGGRRRELVVGRGLECATVPRIGLAHGAQGERQCGERRCSHRAWQDKLCGRVCRNPATEATRRRAWSAAVDQHTRWRLNTAARPCPARQRGYGAAQARVASVAARA